MDKPKSVIILDCDYENYSYAYIDDDRFLVRMWNEHESYFNEVTVLSFAPHTGHFWGTKVPFLVDTYFCQRIPYLNLDISRWEEIREKSIDEQAQFVKGLLSDITGCAECYNEKMAPNIFVCKRHSSRWITR